MPNYFRRTPLGRYLDNRPEVLTHVASKLAREFVNSSWKITYEPYTQSRFESYVKQNFPWLEIFTAAMKCRAPLGLSVATLSSNSYRQHLASGLAELGLPSVRSLLLQKQPANANVSKPNPSTPSVKKVGNQDLELQPLTSDYDGKFPKYLGQKLGQRLVAQYVEFLSKQGPSSDGISIYELLEDAEKDLKASAVRKYIPNDVWSTLAANGGLGEYVFELREAALDVILHSLAEFEGRRPNAAAKNAESQSGGNHISKGALKPLSGAVLEPPAPLLHVDPTTFEQYCAEWSIYLGYRDAKVTRAVKDGGYDIAASKMIAQCKFQELPVGVRPIRELHGVSAALGKQALFFSLNGYSRDAVIEAGQFKMQLWTVHPLQGKLVRVGLESGGMNEGDFHSGPHGFSPNTAYPNSQYGSGFDEDADWNQ